MKVIRHLPLCSLVLVFGLSASAIEAPPVENDQSPPTPAETTSIVSGGKSAHHRAWRKVTSTVNSLGKTVSRTNDAFIELETGMHYLSGNEWLEASEQIDIDQNGASATHGQHKATFSGQINVEQPISLTAPDGHIFRSRVLGISFFDTATGQSALLAELKNSAGAVDGNKVLYQDAFTDIKADIRYTYTKAGLEQDIILRERLGDTPQDYGLNPATTKLQVLTEFFNAPAAEKKTIRRGGIPVDDKLVFGGMQMGRGRAFLLNDQAKPDILVDKQWSELEGRQFLIENVDYSRIAPQLATLPARVVAGVKHRVVKPIASLKRRLPVFKQAKIEPVKMMRVADLREQSKGFVLDYSLLNTDQTNYTFKGDTTYFVRGNLNLSGTTVIEGGAVVKYTNGATITIFGTVDCLAEAYHPAVLTSYKDNTAGESVSAGTPTGTYASTALSLFTGGNLQHLHIRYADTGIYSPQVFTLTDMQFLHCNKAIDSYHTTFSVRNILMYDVTNGFCGEVFTGLAEHLTFHQGTKVVLDVDDPYCNSSMSLLNSLVFGFSGWGSCTPSLDHTEYATSDPGTVFQTVGAAAHYLADASAYRNAGTTNIDADLRLSIGKQTTYPPIVYENQFLPGDTQLFPCAGRDTDLPDLGYHYDTLDYAFGAVQITNFTLSVDAGTAIATYSPFSLTNYGIGSRAGSSMLFNGTATDLIHVVRYSTVQEQANTNWTRTASSIVTVGNGGGVLPIARFNSTEFSILANETYSFLSGKGEMEPIVLRNCQFKGGGFYTEFPSLQVSNCLFERVACSVVTDNGPISLQLRNNLFFGGTLSLTQDSEESVWSFVDNIFDHTTFDFKSVETVTHGYNAYIGTDDRLLPDPSLGHDVAVTNYVLTNYTTLPGSPALWLKADAGITTNANGFVTQWNDQSGNGNNATQSNTNHSPVFVANVKNGKPAIRFDGDQTDPDLGDFLHGTGDVGLSAGFTSFVVYSMADRAINEQIPVFIGEPGELNKARAYYIRNGFGLGSVNELAFGGWGNDPGSRYIIPASTFRIWGYRLNEGMSAFKFFDTDGTYTYTDTEPMSGLETPSAGYYVGGIGTDYPVYNFQGDILEVIFYASTLSDSNQTAAINYLKQKYAIPFTPYETGPLGRYYQVANSPLIDAGSQNATNAALFHYTTQASQVPETNSVVDIGYHYVATDANGSPVDTDADGTPDYQEDANGNGVVNTGETDWESATDQGLKVFITQPKANSNIP